MYGMGEGVQNHRLRARAPLGRDRVGTSGRPEALVAGADGTPSPTTLRPMPPVLYWISISHPSQVARKMLHLKGVDYRVADVLPLNQRVHLRLAGFRGGTVPALKLDGQKLQRSREISRALDARWPQPPLFPADPDLRSRVEEAEVRANGHAWTRQIRAST